METTNNELKIDWAAFIEWFNLTLRQYGSSIAPIKVITKGKKAQVQRIVNSLGSKSLLADAVIKMAKSNLLNGRVVSKRFPHGFIASFTWLLENDERVADVVNGTYDNPPERELTPAELRMQEAEEREAERQRLREENRRIAEADSERRRRQREWDAAHAATPEEMEAALRGFELPQLRPEELSPRERIFGEKPH